MGKFGVKGLPFCTIFPRGAQQKIGIGRADNKGKKAHNGLLYDFLLIPSFALPKTLNFDAINHCKLRLSLASYRIAASGLRILCLDSSPL